jgi:hypothetical protein
LIYVRSRRSIVTLAVLSGLGSALFAGLATAAFSLPNAAVAGVALALGAVGAAALVVRAVVKLRAWPPGKLGVFRDRLLVIQDRHERGALWSNMESITLTEPNSWPHARITDRLTIQLKNGPVLRFKPAVFGLEPLACRDLVLKLRDDPELRARLPEFDSLRDLAISPVVTGELIEPRL